MHLKYCIFVYFLQCPPSTVLGMKKGPCISHRQPLKIVNCTCPSGSKLTLVHKTDGKDTYICQSCPRGQVIDGTGKCGPCPAGKAAIPGIFIKEWAMGPVSKLFRTECSGDNCNGVSCYFLWCIVQYLSVSCFLLFSFFFLINFFSS